jgi:hypothetical protein
MYLRSASNMHIILILPSYLFRHTTTRYFAKLFNEIHDKLKIFVLCGVYFSALT